MTKVISMKDYLEKKKERGKIEKCRDDFCSFIDYCMGKNDKVELSTGETYSPGKFRRILDNMFFYGS